MAITENRHFGHLTYCARPSRKYPFDNWRYVDTKTSIYEDMRHLPQMRVASASPDISPIPASVIPQASKAHAAGMASPITLMSPSSRAWCSRASTPWAGCGGL